MSLPTCSNTFECNCSLGPVKRKERREGGRERGRDNLSSFSSNIRWPEMATAATAVLPISHISSFPTCILLLSITFPAKSALLCACPSYTCNHTGGAFCTQLLSFSMFSKFVPAAARPGRHCFQWLSDNPVHVDATLGPLIC